jgi:hypothetical protein
MMKIALLLAAMVFQPGEGVFRSEAPRKTDGWLGLYCGRICALQPASLEYAVDARDPNRLNAVSRPGEAFLLFRDVPGLTPGPVAEAPFENESLGWKSVVPLALGEARYELRVTARTQFLEGGAITLKHGGVSQVLYRMPELVDEAHVSLRFAGDLDRDGKLDLIMTNSPKYSVSPFQLYLSSAARAGELVREVAMWERSAC